MNARTAKIVFILFLAGMTLSFPAFAGFMDQLLESVVTGSSSGNSSGGSQDYEQTQQSLYEYQQHLDEAYSNVRQKQAAGQDTTEDLAHIQNLEKAVNDRKRLMRQMQLRENQAARYRQTNQNRANQQQLDEAYYQLRQKQNAGSDTTQDEQNIRYMEQQMRNNSRQYGNGQRSSFGNNWNNDPFNDQDSFQDDDNDGFRVRFGG